MRAARGDGRAVWLDLVDLQGNCGWSKVLYSPGSGEEAYRILQEVLRQKPTPGASACITELERLAALHRSGALSNEEIQEAKRKLL